MTNTATEASSNPAPAAPQREYVGQMNVDRLGDQQLGLRTRTQDWSWDEVVRESAARGSLAKSLSAPGPFHIGVLLENDPEFLFWLGGAALPGAPIVGINPNRCGAEPEAEARYVDFTLSAPEKSG